MLGLRSPFKPPELPEGFVVELEKLPSAQELNRLLSRCNVETHPPQRLELALKKSIFCLSIIDDSTGKLSGFVRVTSDKGLNANLWNLAAEPGRNQDTLIAVLIYRALSKIRKDMSGCSISVAAPPIAIEALQDQGFVIDPGGIRAMGFRLR